MQDGAPAARAVRHAAGDIGARKAIAGSMVGKPLNIISSSRAA
ncbi:MAG: hypothetical protein ABSA46_03105 [Thermodesulfovibrionales bacterium]